MESDPKKPRTEGSSGQPAGSNPPAEAAAHAHAAASSSAAQPMDVDASIWVKSALGGVAVKFRLRNLWIDRKSVV